MVPELLVLALDFHRAPLRFPHLTEPNRPLPKAFDTLFNAFAAALAPQNIDATAAALGGDPARIEEAARFFVRQVLLAPGADHYRVLGLSRSAGAPTVREHYHLLVRLFHPDRSGEEDELDARLTARINDAYTTLRDPDARRRYDENLGPFGGADDPESDPAAFFRASEPIGEDSTLAGAQPPLPRRLRRLSALLLLGLATAGIALPLLQMANAPALRTNPDKNAVVPPPSTREPGTCGAAQVSAPPAQHQTAAEQPSRRPTTAVESASTRPPSAPAAPARDTDRLDTADRVDRLIRRFAGSYEAGDAGGFAALFTRNAQVNGGQGSAFIRSDYAAFFARVPERHLEVRRLSWHAAADGKIAVKANVGLAVRDRSRSQWRRLAGVIDFEMAETPGGLRISKMSYSLKPL